MVSVNGCYKVGSTPGVWPTMLQAAKRGASTPPYINTPFNPIKTMATNHPLAGNSPFAPLTKRPALGLVLFELYAELPQKIML
jgi:hypothetical protein